MRFVLFLFILTAVACAKQESGTDNPSTDVQCDRTDLNNYMVEFPDGIVRKSEWWDCLDGCVLFLYVNDHSISLRTCEPPPRLEKVGDREAL